MLEQKLVIAEKLDELGVDIIEAGFPISSPGDFHSVTEIAKLVRNAKGLIERAVGAVSFAKSFVEDVEFFAEDAGRTDNAHLARVCEAVIKAGATVLNIPDTTGYCLPEEYGSQNKIPERKWERAGKYSSEEVVMIFSSIKDLHLATEILIPEMLNRTYAADFGYDGDGLTA
ncbi:hypothetical protein FQR65_LT15794 [Abscondita terminalis]|nr:hypothetical protein FQR65_LT15794 [Abscondita terminalis]